MPVYRYTQGGKAKWYVKANYTDSAGKHRQKKKMGFPTKREAAQWEADFLRKAAGSTDMLFSDFVDQYFSDMAGRLKETTLYRKRGEIDKWITPDFGRKRLGDITVRDVREWQGRLMESGLAPTSQRVVNGMLSSLFNHAVKFYGLPQNPCRIAGSIGKAKREEMSFWTHDEYKEFISHVEAPELKAAYDTLFYTGIRIGELLALTPGDIDLKGRRIAVTKTCESVKGKGYVMMEPKTRKSRRSVTIPQFLADELEGYMKSLYGLEGSQRIFARPGVYYNRYLDKVCAECGLRRIRIHDLRHSHASLLIEMGCDPLVIQERLGHERIETTLGIYSHLYPDKQEEVADKLDGLKE